MFSYRSKLMTSLLLAALWTIQPALADTVTCVTSPGALTLALSSAETASGTTYIELMQGTYDVSSTLLTNTTATYNNLQLLGGYTDNTCSTRTVNPENTIIDGANGSYTRFSMNAGANLVVEGLRFQNFSGGLGAGVQIGNRGLTEIRFNHFYKTGLTISDAATPSNLIVSVDNNLVDESEPGQDGLHIGANDGDTVTLTGNTIGYAANRSLYLCMNSGIATLANNIIWGSYGGTDIRIGCDSGGSFLATFDDNTYGTLDGAEDSNSSGTLHSDPLFIGGGNYRLSTAPTLSPSINSGDNNPAAGVSSADLDGNSRVVGSAVDRGAYESSYDDTAGNTFVVTSTADTAGNTCGTICTLRQAINAANAVNVFHYINFALQNQGANCTNVITLASNLPTIKYGMRIDGYSQPGSKANTLTTGDNAKRCVVLDGGNSTSVATGLFYFNTTDTAPFWVQGMAFEGFTSEGLSLASGNGDLIWGNQFGGKIGNLTLTPNNINIGMDAAGARADIGGSSPSQRNVIDSSPNYGIKIPSGGFFGDSTGNSIVNNLIGTDAAESTSGGNYAGIEIQTGGNTVSANVIGNNTIAINVEGSNATGNTIDHNLIGISETSCVSYPVPICFGGSSIANTYGVSFAGGSHDNLVQYNTIWNNELGIEVSGNSQHNTFGGNSIYSPNNISHSGYGIALNGSNPGISSDNDGAPAAQSEPNRGLNYPVITRAIGGTSSGTVSGTLASINHIYSIEVFSLPQCDLTGNGEGAVFHGSGSTTISNAPSGQNGSTSFSIPFNVEAGGSLAGRAITLTATDDLGNTSEFSKCMAYTCDVIFKHGFDTATAEKCP